MFFLLLPIATFKDVQRQKELKYGRRLKGPEMLTPKQFNRTVKGDGVGFKTNDMTPMLRIPLRAEAQHMQIIGDTGAGKSALMFQVLRQVQSRGDAAIVYDPAREFVKRFYNPSRGDVILNPLDKRCPYWGPADELRSRSEAKALAASLFQPPQDKKGEFFIESPQKIFAFLMAYGPTPDELVRVNRDPSAGFILGKEGLANELAILNAALERDIPAILVDLTNTIRHGDVCLLGASDPFLIEAKVGKNLNNRGKKQKRNLEKLHDFYETDKSLGLRGIPVLQRRANKQPEQTYVDLLNECIVEAVDKGQAFRQPEDGLHYVVLTDKAPDIKVVLEAVGLKDAVWPFFLNEHKAQRTWAPYVPFLLSIIDPDHLWEFIRGSLFIFVFVELDAICKIARDCGHKANFDIDNEHFPLGIETSVGGTIRVSTHMLTRIGLEFLSPRWIVSSSLERSSDPAHGESQGSTNQRA